MGRFASQQAVMGRFTSQQPFMGRFTTVSSHLWEMFHNGEWNSVRSLRVTAQHKSEVNIALV
jgi:hypothetical protein